MFWSRNDNCRADRLEGILHPLYFEERDRFLRLAARRRTPIVALDVLLLYETGGDRDCDTVILVSAPPFIQAARVLGRSGVTAERLRDILAQQMPDIEKRRRAEFVVETGLGKGESLRRLTRIVRLLRRRPARRWPPSAQPRWDRK